jgi:hypothetical protein
MFSASRVGERRDIARREDLADRNRLPLKTKAAVVFTERSTSKVADDDAVLAMAMRFRAPVIGIATSGGRLPQALIRLAEQRIVVPPIDAAVVAGVIEAVTAAKSGTTAHHDQ